MCRVTGSNPRPLIHKRKDDVTMVKVLFKRYINSRGGYLKPGARKKMLARAIRRAIVIMRLLGIVSVFTAFYYAVTYPAISITAMMIFLAVLVFAASNDGLL